MRDMTPTLHEFDVFLEFFDVKCKVDYIIKTIGEKSIIINILGDGTSLPYDL
jgi:hypothetical protein